MTASTGMQSATCTAKNGTVLIHESSESFPSALPDSAVVAASPCSSEGDHRTINAKAANICRRLKAFLRSLDMTVYQISQATARAPFGKGTCAYIRDAFYAEIESGQTPDIHQLAALAKLTGYRLVDWLALFGYHVDDIPRLQLELHTKRTVLLPSTIYDPLVPLPWIRRFDTRVDLDLTQPLVTVIDAMGCAPIGLLDSLNQRRFLYARVGRRDDMMRPRLAAGSIVRVDPAKTAIAHTGGPSPVYLVEHRGGLCCCYAEMQDQQHVILLPDDGGSRVMRFRKGTEVRILGTVDLEFRPVQAMLPEMSPLRREERQSNHRLRPLDPVAERNGGAGEYARTTRERTGLRFREAQRMTHQLASRFEDRRYSVALGSLSDTETKDVLPRHIPKIFSLCVAYNMDLWQYLRAGGVPVDELNGERIPRQFLYDEDGHPDAVELAPMISGLEAAEAMNVVTERLGEVPFFFLRSAGTIIGQKQLSLDDVYVWGRREPVLHPLLQGAMLLIVNRRQRCVPDARSRLSSPKGTLFLIRTRAGRFLAGMSALDGNVVLVRPHTTSRAPVMTFPAHDVEVMGRISAVLRTIGGEAQNDT
jgi:hypothetical protein